MGLADASGVFMRVLVVNVDRILTVGCLTEAPDEVKLEDGEV
jgi:hypothetical protein